MSSERKHGLFVQNRFRCPAYGGSYKSLKDIKALGPLKGPGGPTVVAR